MPRSGDEASSKHVAKGELIGLRVEVVDTRHPPLRGLAGQVVDETRDTLVVETPGGEKVVPKRGQRFRFTLPDGRSATLDGARIAYRPADRLKKAH